ncbi:MAG TPA: hypothetical protein PKH32_10310, partial [Verrucomicrobiota bacterium]|nr:hypothetical protein [Verrucomicrobiota bacterium]
MIARDFLDSLAATAAQALGSGIEQIFGPGSRAKILGPFSWADLAIFGVFVLVVLLVNALAASLIRRKSKEPAAEPESQGWRRQLFGAIGKPLYALIWIYGIYLASMPLFLAVPDGGKPDALRSLLARACDLSVFAILFWLFFRLTHVLELRLAEWTSRTESKLDNLLAPLLGKLIAPCGFLRRFCMAADEVLQTPQRNQSRTGEVSPLFIRVRRSPILGEARQSLQPVAHHPVPIDDHVALVRGAPVYRRGALEATAGQLGCE